ncbi:MAG TPA: hypothetical protein PKA18_09130, partial [Ottowia sp.]|nr:hypothetical protein [Ottowia sp.]
VPTLTCGLVRSNFSFAMSENSNKEQLPVAWVLRLHPDAGYRTHGHARGSGSQTGDVSPEISTAIESIAACAGYTRP